MTKLIQMKIMMTLSALLLLASTAGAQEQGGRWSLTPMAGMTWSTLSGYLSLVLGYRLECFRQHFLVKTLGITVKKPQIKNLNIPI